MNTPEPVSDMTSAESMTLPEPMTSPGPVNVTISASSSFDDDDALVEDLLFDALEPMTLPEPLTSPKSEATADVLSDAPNFVEDLYDAIGDITVVREYLLAAGLPPKVATKYLMELVVPKKPVVITVGMSFREDYR